MAAETSSQQHRPEPADDSGTGKATGRGGLPAPVALLIVLAITVVGGWLDLRHFGGLDALLSTAFLLGYLFAIVAVRPRGVLLVMLTPPLLLILATGIDVLAFTPHSPDPTLAGLAVATPVISHFPVMAGGTALTLLVGVVRLFHRRQLLRRERQAVTAHP
jgi:hypothetical protein